MISLTYLQVCFDERNKEQNILCFDGFLPSAKFPQSAGSYLATKLPFTSRVNRSRLLNALPPYGDYSSFRPLPIDTDHMFRHKHCCYLYRQLNTSVSFSLYQSLLLYLYIYIYIYKVKLATIVECDPKAHFSIATATRCRGGCYSFPWLTLHYPWYVPYNAEC